MADVELKISGLADLERALEEMPRKAARRIVRQEATSAAAAWADEMRARVRRGPHHQASGQTDYGVIAENILEKTTVRDDLSASVKVGPAKAAGGYMLFWVKFLEFGTRLRHRKGGASTGEMPAFPFIRPAFESKASSVLDRFISGIRDALAEAGMRLS